MPVFRKKVTQGGREFHQVRIHCERKDEYGGPCSGFLALGSETWREHDNNLHPSVICQKCGAHFWVRGNEAHHTDGRVEHLRDQEADD